MGIPIIGDIIKTVGNVIDDLHTSGEEKQQAALEKLKIVHEQLLGQQAINKTEAQHKSIFVAGWRPFIGWVSGFSIAYQFIMYPLLLWVWAMIPEAGEAPPPLDTSTLMTLVLSMLGVGVMRSYDKREGTDTISMKKK